MAGSKVLQIFLLISLMIFSTHALEVYLTEGIDEKGFEYRTEINVGYDSGNGSRYYNGCAENKTYVARPDTTKIIVYIRSESQMIRDTLGDLTLRELLWCSFHYYHYELLYLIVFDFIRGDEHLISEFLHHSIKPHPGQTSFQTYTIGENYMNLTYKTLLGDFDTYQEDENVFRGKLYKRIRDLYTNNSSRQHL